MTAREAAPPQQPAQTALFGSDAPVEQPAPATAPATTQDVELVADVVRLAADPGYRVVPRSQRVLRVDPGTTGWVEDVPRYEAQVVLQLLDAGWLELGGNHTITYRGKTGPSRSVLVPRSTRKRVARWQHYKPIA